MQDGNLLNYYEKELINNNFKNNDPLIKHLIDAIILFNAGTHLKLDAEFLETCTVLLQHIAPHALRPLPATSIIQFHTQNYSHIPKNTLLTTSTPSNKPCYFSTTYSLACLPLEIREARLASGRLSITLTPYMPFRLKENKLSFFINLNTPYAYDLYELLLKHTQKIFLSFEENDPIQLDKNCLQAEGFDGEQSLFPYDPRENLAHNLLTEFFNFPQKFLFFSLALLESFLIETPLKLTFLFDTSNTALEKIITQDSFKLNCTPIINIFPEISEPLMIDHTKTEYSLRTGVYAIQEVTARNAQGDLISFYPHYKADKDHYYQLQSNMRLRFSSKKPELFYAHDWVVTAKFLCTNQNLPAELPYGGNALKIDFSHPENYREITEIKVLTPFTPAKNCRSDQENAIQTFIYYLLNSIPVIPGIIHISTHSAKTVLPLKQIASSAITGNDIHLHVGTEKTPQNQLFFLGSILDRYFSLQVSINSYTRLIMIDHHGKEIYRWPARCGKDYTA